MYAGVSVNLELAYIVATKDGQLDRLIYSFPDLYIACSSVLGIFVVNKPCTQKGEKSFGAARRWSALTLIYN